MGEKGSQFAILLYQAGYCYRPLLRFKLSMDLVFWMTLD
jgi:hypothetical protein